MWDYNADTHCSYLTTYVLKQNLVVMFVARIYSYHCLIVYQSSYVFIYPLTTPPSFAAPLPPPPTPYSSCTCKLYKLLHCP